MSDLTDSVRPMSFAGYAPPPPPPPPPTFGPQGYAPPPSYGPPTQQAPNAVVAFVLSLAGFVTGFLLLGWIGFFMARASRRDYPTCGLTQAAYWIGLVDIIFTIIGLLVGVVAVVLFVIAAASGSM
jgi:hypothetical protein